MLIDNTIASPNFDDRPQGTTIDALVLHSGEGTKKSDLDWLSNPAVHVSSHFYVDRAGLVYQLVDPHKRAWHAGASFYAGRTGWNDFSIGIELEHKRGQDWPPIQRAILTDLCRVLISQFPIQQSLIVAHRWIAPGRKADPTDWSDFTLHAWIAGLFVRQYRAGPYGAIAQQDRKPQSLAAKYYKPGEIFESDDETLGYLHDRTGIGFVAKGQAEAV